MTKKTDDGRMLLETILVDGNGDEIEIVNGRLVTMLAVGVVTEISHRSHQRIHDKKSFTMHFQNAVTNIGEKTVIAFNAPVSNTVHIIITIQSTHGADVYLYRDTSIDVDEGTQITPSCRNQVAILGEATIASIETSPVVNRATTYNETQIAGANLTIATELDQLVLLGGEGPKALGAERLGRDTEEWNFSDSVQVAIVIDALTNDSATHIIRVDFYEAD